MPYCTNCGKLTTWTSKSGYCKKCAEKILKERKRQEKVSMKPTSDDAMLAHEYASYALTICDNAKTKIEIAHDTGNLSESASASALSFLQSMLDDCKTAVNAAKVGDRITAQGIIEKLEASAKQMDSFLSSGSLNI